MLTHKKIGKKSAIYLILIISIIAVGSIFTTYQNFEPLRTLSALTAMCSILIHFLFKYSKNESIYILKEFSFAIFYFLITSILASTITNVEIIKVEYTGEIRLSGLSNPAHVASMAYLSLISNILIFKYSKKIAHIWLAVLCLLIIISTGTRMPTLLGIALLIMFFAKDICKSKNLIILTAIVASITILATMNFELSIIERFMSATNSGRDLIWDHLLGVFPSYKYIGIGFGHQIRIMPPELSEKVVTIAAHNEYLRLLVELGIILTPIFFYFFFLYIYNSTKESNSSFKYFFFIIISFLIYSITDNTISMSWTLLTFLSLKLFNTLNHD